MNRILRIFYIASLLCLLAIPIHAAVLIYEPCETWFDTNIWHGNGIDDTTKLAYNSPNAAGRTLSYARAGSYSWYFTRAKADCTGNNVCQHVMLNLKKAAAEFPRNVERWVGYSALYPAGQAFTPTQSSMNLESQIHANNDQCGPSQPTIALQCRELAQDGRQILLRDRSTCGTTPNTTTYNQGTGFDADWSQPLTTVVWQDVVMRIKLSYTDGSAITQVWLNGELMLNTTNANWYYQDADGTGYWTVGAYTGETQTTPITAYIDEIRIGDASSSYAQVCPPINPSIPSITYPTAGLPGVSLTPTLTSSGYAESRTDLQAVFSHRYSSWKITSDVAGNNIVVSSTSDTTNLVSWAVPRGYLAPNTTYYAFVLHASWAGVDKDGDGVATDDTYPSNYSPGIQFTTITGQGFPYIEDFEP